jgi:uncharacterized protein (TIGR04255 family)
MSTVFPTLKSDPIVEAQITIVFNSAAEITEDAIKKFLNSINYSNTKPLMRASFKIENSKAETEHTLLGHRAENGNFVLQCTSTTFSLSEINKYSSWDNVKENAKQIWEKFAKAFLISNISEVSVRYINRLQLPCSIVVANEYWKSANPQLPSEFGTIHEYFNRIGFSFPNSEVKGLLIQLLDNMPAAPGHINLLVDILTMIQSDFKPDAPDLWTKLEHLRNCKNVIFFDNLTDKAVQLYR